MWGTEWNIIIICGWWSFPFLGHTYMGTCSDGTWTIRHQSTVTDKTWDRLSSSQLDFIASGSGGFFLIMIIPLLKSHVSKPKCIAVFFAIYHKNDFKKMIITGKKKLINEPESAAQCWSMLFLIKIKWYALKILFYIPIS